MKTKFIFFVALLALSACNNSNGNKDELGKLKTQIKQDSVLLVQSKQKDSAIASYVGVMSRIEEKLDSIKIQEKMISTGATPENSAGSETSILSDIKSIDDLIIKYNKEINHLSASLKKLEKKDANMEGIIADLTKQLNEKEKEVTELQGRLSLTSDSLKVLTSRFNDSLELIKQQRAELYAMTTKQNTVYYVVGTVKQLEKLGAIDKKGGFIGIGKAKELNPNINNEIFTKADKTNLNMIPLNGKFKSFMTEHANGTYNISGGKGKIDTLLILNPGFWNDSKYAVITIK